MKEYQGENYWDDKKNDWDRAYAERFIDPGIVNEKGTTFPDRHRDVRSDPNNYFIKRHENAGKIVDKHIVMHNGLRVLNNCYYETFCDVLKTNKGVHEPAEERMFAEVLTHTRPGATMIELGAYWAFYSMWFLQQIPDAKAYMIEPEAKWLEVGKKNFAINDMLGDFTQAKIGRDGINLAEFCKEKGIDYIDILHSDIQGAELQMLQDVSGLLSEKKIKYVVVSTHNDELHYSCKALLEDHDYRIVASCDFETETFCFDGILVACHKDNQEIPYTPLGNRTHTKLRDLTTALTLVDGVRIIVPDSLNSLTTYVLHEQQDWFEDEIRFVRCLLQPGERVIDIGANYGVYTLSMAKLVGPTGCVWAFEPASTTAGLLAASITANDFNQVVLEQSALSSVKGTAQLSLNDNSEMNALVHDNECRGETEAVTLTTLDECLAPYDWHDIAFVKLDAEGEEGKILRGGTHFFAKESPLVQYEVKAGKALHLELVHAFVELGYNSYRLVPGLNLLVPFDENVPVDGFLLNLFSCKPDRAIQLAEGGFLIEAADPRRLRDVQSHGVPGVLDGDQTNSWFTPLMKFPYGKLCAESWRKTVAAGKSREVEAALSLYWLSGDTSLPAAERFAALEESFIRLKAICETRPAYLRLSSFARVARDYGARTLAVKALNQLCNIFQQSKVNPSEPFLAPGERFDSLSPKNAIADWVAAAAVEELERNSAFSSFYNARASLQRLELIRSLGFGSPEMDRRLKLLQRHFGTSNA